MNELPFSRATPLPEPDPENSVRLPPVDAIYQELHAEYGCRAGWRADGFIQVVFGDFEADTVRGWIDWVVPFLRGQELRRQRQGYLYDIRAVKHIPLANLQLAMRATTIPGSEYSYVAGLVTNPVLVNLLDPLIRIAGLPKARLFGNEDEAVGWLLNEHAASGAE